MPQLSVVTELPLVEGEIQTYEVKYTKQVLDIESVEFTVIDESIPATIVIKAEMEFQQAQIVAEIEAVTVELNIKLNKVNEVLEKITEFEEA